MKAASARQLGDRSPRALSLVRLIAIALIGGVAALIYYGLRDRFFLPACDSDRAKRSSSRIMIGPHRSHPRSASG